MDQFAHSDLKIAQPPQMVRKIALERKRTAIISRLFKTGDRLVERKLGVNRSVVREAIRYVAAEGQMENLPKKNSMAGRLNRQKDQPDIRDSPAAGRGGGRVTHELVLSGHGTAGYAILLQVGRYSAG